MPVDIVTLSKERMSEIMAIELLDSVYAWPDHSYHAAFRCGWNVVGVESEQKLAAVMVYRNVGEHSELLNLIVAPFCRRRGLAKVLLHRLIDDAERQGCDSVFLEVRDNNDAAISLYHDLGFTLVNRRHGYYNYNGILYDALELALPISMPG